MIRFQVVSLHLCRGGPWGCVCAVGGKKDQIVCQIIAWNNVQDVPYYCPSCDVNVRRANKAKKQAQAKEMKAKAQLAESRKVESLPKTVTKQVTEEERIAEYDNSASDEDQLVIDTAARNRHKTSKRKHPPPSSESQSPEKRSSSVITQTLPQLEVCY